MKPFILYRNNFPTSHFQGFEAPDVSLLIINLGDAKEPVGEDDSFTTGEGGGGGEQSKVVAWRPNVIAKVCLI